MTDRAARWLGPVESDAWSGLLSVALRLPGALDAQLTRDSGLTHFEYGVMAALSESLERTLRMSDLAVLAEGTLPRLSQVVGRLEKRGLVTRRPDPTDGRYTLATLCDAGWKKVVEAAPGHVQRARELVFDQLTQAQVRQLAAISRRIMQAIDPSDRCLPGNR